jgi:hypothetical protein
MSVWQLQKAPKVSLRGRFGIFDENPVWESGSPVIRRYKILNGIFVMDGILISPIRCFINWREKDFDFIRHRHSKAAAESTNGSSLGDEMLRLVIAAYCSLIEKGHQYFYHTCYLYKVELARCRACAAASVAGLCQST